MSVTTGLGTPFYMAPENANGKCFKDLTVDNKHKIDLWSVGVMLYELYFGKMPFNGENPMAIYSKYEHGNYLIPKKFNPPIEFLDFLDLCIQVGINDRKDDDQLTSHPFLKKSSEDFFVLNDFVSEKFDFYMCAK
jgi:serine/threonine protein kinase